MTGEFWAKLWEIAAGITSPFGVMGCIALIVFSVYLRKKIPKAASTALFSLIGLLALIVVLGAVMPEPAYNVRVLVKDPRGNILEIRPENIDARIRNEKKPVRDEWQFDIFAADLPPSREVEFWARAPEKYLPIGSVTKKLDGRQRQVNVEIILSEPERAKLRGIVVDPSGAAIKGARVYVVGSPEKVVVTDQTGGFQFDTEVSEGERVVLHTEARGFAPDNQSYSAGRHPVSVTLAKTRRR